MLVSFGSRIVSSQGSARWHASFSRHHAGGLTRALQRLSSHRPAAMTQKQANIVVISDKNAPELEELEKLPAGATVVAAGQVEELLKVGEEKLASVNVVLTSGGALNVIGTPKENLQKLWPKLPALEWIHALSAGVTHVLWEDLAKSKIVLTNAKGVFSHSLSEYAITACLYFAKRMPELQANQKAGKWDQLIVEELKGSKLGIIGYGDIGQAAARLGRAFGMRIAALRRRTELSKEEQQQGLEVYSPDRLEELTGSCDYLITALPATPATEKLVSAAAIKAMQPHTVFINVGRGSTVDEAALTTALREKKIRGAALDVFREEPLPVSSPLWQLDNVLISPHCVDMTKTFIFEAVEQFVSIAKQYVEGKSLSNVCDKEAGY